MNFRYDEFLRYTQEERDKWRLWFAAHPDAVEVELQPGARYPTCLLYTSPSPRD